MEATISLILSRHGETEENKLHIMQGQMPVESVEGLYKRAGEFLQFLQTNFPGKRILAIGHGGFNRAIIVRIEKRQQEEILKLPIMKNTACLRFSL